MKILLSSFAFRPSVGGIETVGRLLAEEWHAMGHHVTVVTETRAESGASASLPYAVVRAPTLRQLVGLIHRADGHVINNFCTRYVVASLLARKPPLLTFHTWLARPDGNPTLVDRSKRLLATVVSRKFACSQALARTISSSCRVIENPFDNQLFQSTPADTRTRDLLFVGRLVSDKGVDVLLKAMAQLGSEQLRPTLTVAGNGPELPNLQQAASDFGLADQVQFLGSQPPGQIASLMRSHRILVIPSVWQEPFGLVAIEAIACGCSVIASHVGGLPDAVGDCGLLVPPGDPTRLANAISQHLKTPGTSGGLQAMAQRHISRHTSRAVALRYLALMSSERHQTIHELPIG